jgi:hypothetical protein
MAALARAQGQPYAIHHPVASSFDAHRMLHLAAEHGAACDPETGTCTVPRAPVPSPGAAPVTGAVLPGRYGEPANA